MHQKINIREWMKLENFFCAYVNTQKTQIFVRFHYAQYITILRRVTLHYTKMQIIEASLTPTAVLERTIVVQ